MRSHLFPPKVVMCGSPKLRHVIMVAVGAAVGATVIPSVGATLGEVLGADDAPGLLGDAVGETDGDVLGAAVVAAVDAVGA